MGHHQLPLFFKHIQSHVAYCPLSTQDPAQFSLELLTDEMGAGEQEMSSPAQVLVFDNEDHHMMNGR